MPPNGANLTITNPLVLYRSLIATNRLKPDPAQHRLALHLQKIYDRLIDYEPSIEYSLRLQQLHRAVGANQNAQPQDKVPIGRRGIWKSLLEQKDKRDSVALTRVLASHEAAIDLQSPQGLMLHGEVGTGKSMLIDLFEDCLPNRKKRRWHFNTFMLDTISRLESLRRSRTASPTSAPQDEYPLLLLARDLIQTSPILFLDEFQLPDRAASKILSNLMTSFFQLGGVLIATSNRMPEELAKAAGMEFARPVSKLSRLGWSLGRGIVGRDDDPGQKGEFAMFLEVLRARCEVWEMEGKNDYRRLGAEDKTTVLDASNSGSLLMPGSGNNPKTASAESSPDTVTEPSSESKMRVPKYFLINPTPEELDAFLAASTSFPVPESWTSRTLTVYGRPLFIPRQHSNTALFTFSELCAAILGPADYITIASTYHTLIVTDIPTLTFLQKNEARRFITLLDSLYEARCRLLISASSHPDFIFFPDPSSPSSQALSGEKPEILDMDAVHPETYSEIHQDLTSPFRPNISSYGPSLAADALEDDPPNRVRRPGSSYTDERRLRDGSVGPDFANIGGLTGEDEQFAVKRAESRIWELCSARWWSRDVAFGEDAGGEMGRAGLAGAGWWRPLPAESRHWERSTSTAPVPAPAPASMSALEGPGGAVLRMPSNSVSEDSGHNSNDQDIASRFRTTSDPPPRIQWTHMWGTVQWGKRAGTWGRGVEGLDERRKEKEGNNQKDEGGEGPKGEAN